MTQQTMPATDAYLGLRAFADELARCGLEHACTSPGSRSTPLVLSLAREPGIRATSHIDERCGSFFALGLAKATGRPVALACTSGTAAANYAPAVHEAHEARVPLLVLTADRPPELREIGAGQTIDQVKLYGAAAKWFFEVDDQPATPERMRWLRQLACRAYWTALEGRPGPVHLNFSLREPLVLDEPLPAVEPGGGGRAGGRPWVTRPRSQPVAASAIPAWGRRWRALRTSSRCRCWPSRCRARAAAAPRSPTTTRSCATRASPPPRPPTSSCASATSRPRSRCASGCMASTRSRSPSTPNPRGRTRRAASARS
jgi:2-succinyl-5-enolpyruvyl-6-hydroxy-3-cyclohexene-1-carboxylate synthase